MMADFERYVEEVGGAAYSSASEWSSTETDEGDFGTEDPRVNGLDRLPPPALMAVRCLPGSAGRLGVGAMKEWLPTSQQQATDALARFFWEAGVADISVGDRNVFGEEVLHLGEIVFYAAGTTPAEMKGAIAAGSFVWRPPSAAIVHDRLCELLGIGADAPVGGAKKAAGKAAPNLERHRLNGLLNLTAMTAARAGLIQPRFDALAVALMPLRRPTTIVADTSAVISGGVDFVTRFLHPAARLKIPAIVHMEIINQADRYLGLRRRGHDKPAAELTEHLRSQPAQRVLMRLERREDAEVERSPILGDPLRSAFRDDKEPDLNGLNLSVPLRSYVDRLVLESAIQHQALVRPGHPVMLLTSDQGQAKMAIAEGVEPLFFQAVTGDLFYDRCMTGARYHPLDGRMVRIPLTAMLWELATAFGEATLSRSGSQASFAIRAIDRDLGWSSFHGAHDLLWCSERHLPGWPRRTGSQNAGGTRADLSSARVAEPGGVRERGPLTTVEATRRAVGEQRRTKTHNKTNVTFFRLNVQRLVDLVDALASEKLDDRQVERIVQSQTSPVVAEYKRFLLSGSLLKLGEGWAAGEGLEDLADALRAADADGASSILARTPSFDYFLGELGRTPKREPLASALPGRVLATYKALAEITRKGVPIYGIGFFPTPAEPPVEEFARIALREFALLDAEPWGSVGEWLESVARGHGVHPATSRDLLCQASAARLLVLSTEGSTTDTRHDDHVIRMLAQVPKQAPKVETVHIYRGDFLLPGKSSTSLQLRAPSP